MRAVAVAFTGLVTVVLVLVVTVPSELGGVLTGQDFVHRSVLGDAGDVDGDGVDDLYLAIGLGHAGGDAIPAYARSRLRVVSGADPERVLHERTDDEWLLGLRTCAPVGDVDGDGAEELLVTKVRPGGPPGGEFVRAGTPRPGLRTDLVLLPSLNDHHYEVLSLARGGVVVAEGVLTSARDVVVAATELLEGRPALFGSLRESHEAIDPMRPDEVVEAWAIETSFEAIRFHERGPEGGAGLLLRTRAGGWHARPPTSPSRPSPPTTTSGSRGT